MGDPRQLLTLSLKSSRRFIPDFPVDVSTILFFMRAADTYDLSDLVTSSSSDAAGFGPGVAALKSVSMLNHGRFPIAELLEHTTLDEVSTFVLSALVPLFYCTLRFRRQIRYGDSPRVSSNFEFCERKCDRVVPTGREVSTHGVRIHPNTLRFKIATLFFRCQRQEGKLATLTVTEGQSFCCSPRLNALFVIHAVPCTRRLS